MQNLLKVDACLVPPSEKNGPERRDRHAQASQTRLEQYWNWRFGRRRLSSRRLGPTCTQRVNGSLNDLTFLERKI
jgi:hypothetical protein